MTNIKDIETQTFMEALFNDDYTLIDEYLADGFDVNRPYNANGWTPFMWVCKEYPSVRIIEKFLNAGGDVNSANKNGETPFYIAAKKRSSTACLELLVKAGAFTNIKNRKGQTALDYVKSHPQAEMRQDVISYLESLQ